MLPSNSWRMDRTIRASTDNQLYFTLETMEEQLKERLVGASVLVALGVTFIPMFLNIPTMPEPGSWEETVQVKSGDLGLDPPPPNAGETVGPGQPNKPSGVASSVPEPVAGDKAAPHAGTPALMAKPPSASQGNQFIDSVIPSVEALQTPPALSPPMLPDSRQTAVAGWAIQLGSFSSQENAALLEDRLRKLGYKAFVETLHIGDSKVFRVRVGPEMLESKAKELQARLEKDIDLKGLVVRFP
jgi:DedD protein